MIHVLHNFDFTKQPTSISSHGDQNLVSQLFPEPVLFDFYIVPANAHILSKYCSSTPIRNCVRSRYDQ